MSKYKYIVLLLLGFGCFACQQKNAPKPAHLRVLSMIQYTPVKLDIRGKGKNKEFHKTLSLGYSKPSGYQQLIPGYYHITLSVQGKELLKGIYALGKNGYYTLLSMGLLPKKWTVNPQTTLYKLKYIFAGEELESSNAYMPQWMMMRDNYDGNKKSAYIRLVNANPHTTALTIKKDGESLKSGLGYPMESTMLKMKPGRHNLEFLYGETKSGKKKINAKPGYIYTAVIGNIKQQNSNDQLKVSVLSNPSRSLLNSNQKEK